MKKASQHTQLKSANSLLLSLNMPTMQEINLSNTDQVFDQLASLYDKKRISLSELSMVCEQITHQIGLDKVINKTKAGELIWLIADTASYHYLEKDDSSFVKQVRKELDNYIRDR